MTFEIGAILTLLLVAVRLASGDLVFFAYSGGRGKIYHVGIYIGSGKMLHAPNSSSKVRIEALNAGVYNTNYAGARRYIN